MSFPIFLILGCMEIRDRVLDVDKAGREWAAQRGSGRPPGG